MSTYEFRKYTKLLEDQVKMDREYNLSVAKTYGGLSGLMRRNNILE